CLQHNHVLARIETGDGDLGDCTGRRLVEYEGTNATSTRSRDRHPHRRGAVAEPVSLSIASRYCTLPSRCRSVVPVSRPLRSRNVVTLPLVEAVPVIWPRSFRNVCCCAMADPASDASIAASVIVLIPLFLCLASLPHTPDHHHGSDEQMF